MTTPNYSMKQQQYLNRQPGNNETLLAMRKHRSLDNDQFLLMQQQQNLSPSNNMPLSSAPPKMNLIKNRGQQQISNSLNYYKQNNVGGNDYYFQNQNYFCDGQQKQIQQNQPSLFDTNVSNDNLMWNLTAFQPITSQTFLQEFDPLQLQKELLTICDHYNNLISSIHSFWIPKLQFEKQQKEELEIKKEKLERQLVQLQSQANIFGAKHSINQGENAGKNQNNSSTQIRDFTDHSITLHEFKTLKAKLEQSEICFSECSRELQNVELKAKCLEEEKKEAERRIEILSRNNLDFEEQLKLLNEDLNVLRNKLELKNQLLESREKATKKLEEEKEELKFELKEEKKNLNESEHRSSQLLHKIDQMERLQREKDAQLEHLKQRILQQPGTRAEKLLEDKIENMLEERSKLEQIIEQIQKQNDIERQQQLERFLSEREQLQLDIAYLKFGSEYSARSLSYLPKFYGLIVSLELGQSRKELADRHMLIGSQSEKISQFNCAFKNFNLKKENEELNEEEKINFQNLSELELTHQEIERLLKRIVQLEKDKSELIEAFKKSDKFVGIDESNDLHKMALLSENRDELSINIDERILGFKQRILDLEEALKESVECTTEKEKVLNEQKKLIEKLNEQIGKIFESGGGGGNTLIHQQQQNDQLEKTQKLLEEEKQLRQRQISSLRKEFGMALIAEKESAINLILNSCPSIDLIPGLREKLEILQKQKEAIKHSLLIIDEQQKQQNFGVDGKMINLNQKKVLTPPSQTVPPQKFNNTNIQPGRPITSLSATTPYTQPIRILTNNNELYFNKQNGFGGSGGNYGMSAPASFNFEEFENQLVDEEGIWA
ncbi:unnamed protein product [Meloidogyne enterolobii]|uniref:Uncharacterized protein n=1 Tax=Meloidogyne enterolobii TaxID=390850 RepID=A0ACB1A2K0_MELEN